MSDSAAEGFVGVLAGNFGAAERSDGGQRAHRRSVRGPVIAEDAGEFSAVAVGVRLRGNSVRTGRREVRRGRVERGLGVEVEPRVVVVDELGVVGDVAKLGLHAGRGRGMVGSELLNPGGQDRSR